jgi:tripartite-type tricarboxylate transporter receptor subunit TctC
LNGELVTSLRLPDVQQRQRAEACDVIADSPDQFAAAIRAEIAKWAPIVKQAGLRAESLWFGT